MKKSFSNLLLLLIALLSSTAIHAQRLYFEASKPLSDTLNSNAEESLPIYSEQDSTLFFVRSLYAQNTGGLHSGQDIWYTKKDTAGRWTEPKNDLGKLNNEGNNAIVGISSSGRTVYLLNDYGTENSQQAGLSLSFNREQDWSTPNKISIPGISSKQGNFYSLYMHPSEEVVLISVQLENSLGQEDLYVSTKDPFTNEWSEPVHLGPTINTGGFEISPYLTADKQTLFFSSNGHPGYGNADVFVAHRTDTSWTNWSSPENLGDQINSAGFDAYFTAKEDNEVFFVSNRRGSSADIYTSRIITEEERQRMLAQRVEGGGRGAGMLNQNNSTEIGGLDTETQALLDETRALLDEFNRIKTGDGSNNSNTATSSAGSESGNSSLFASQEMLFQLNSAEIQNKFQNTLNIVIETLRQNPSLKAEIVGHADDTGGKDYNLKLSIDRAIEVKQFLVENGISERRIITYGKGSTQPVSDNQTPEARQKNRRVVISFI
ncbi:outer membrane protein OmpA-like peptidoglycan-associated protein [Catalinimonas alkaloidigena]|uniref:OmpA family protein n=1 Tax=Catalinimonas alkaloidigena TaxID=1075417 RepID=UPI0024071F91|nr:OmpA family protein [Catalinimonas alkaloidigena]MDF9798453.1 outer membrane protein OmpA-like peptidoglycan-associated protein [Catalinimonas alkaloidigena]